MKKILAITLCLVMVLCSAVTAFADTGTADGTVLYAKTFDGETGSPTTLEEAGLEIFGTTTATIKEDGALSVTQTGGYNGICLKDDVVGELTTYTMQVTFRWSDLYTNTNAGISACVGGYDNSSETPTLTKIDPTYIKFNGAVNGGETLNSEIINAWKPDANAYDQIPGNWTTLTVEVENDKIVKFTVSVVGVDPVVVFEDPETDISVPAGNPYFRVGNPLGLEIFDIRVVSGRNVNMQTPTLPARPTLQTGSATTVDAGNVLYYQKFNKAFNMTDLSNTGLRVTEGIDGSVKIDEDGYLRVDNATGKKAYVNMFKLPDVILDGLATYTWEMKFRYVSSASNGCVNAAWGENSNGGVKLGAELKYNNGGMFTNIAKDEPVSGEVAAAWVADEFGPGGWVTLTLAVKDGFLYTASITVDDKYSGQQLTWFTDAPENTDLVPFGEDMIYRIGPETVAQFEYIRVVEGVDYTEYKGEYATKSYSGHEDSAAIEEEPEELDRPTVQEQKPVKDNNSGESTDTAEVVVDSGDAVTEEKKGCGGFANSSMAVIGILSVGFALSMAKRKKKE